MPKWHGQSPAGQVAAHQVFGFVPYWMMGQVSSADLARLSTVAYFAVGVNGDGTFHTRGPGWEDYRSSRLTDLVKQAHAAGDRVVLTVNAFDQPTLDQLTHSAKAPYRLARAITGALIAKSLDGVNIDFEGMGSSDRAGLVTFVTELSQQLRAVDPRWQITMDTFGSSASDPSGFFDVKDLTPAVDAFFVMAYDMGRPHAVSPTAPLTGPDPNDTQVVGSYLSTVPPSKLLLGIPLYAYAYPTAGALPGAPVTGASVTLTEDQIQTEASQIFWDSDTQVAWTAWRGGKQWYQTYFDDPESVAAKVRLASQSGLAGVGVWTLGMGNTQAMRSAITLGGATKDWSPSAEPPIGAADALLASLSPFSLSELSAPDLSSADLGGLSSAFSELDSLFGSDFGGLSSGFGGSGAPSSKPGTVGQRASRAGSPGATSGTSRPRTSARGAANPGTTSTTQGTTNPGRPAASPPVTQGTPATSPPAAPSTRATTPPTTPSTRATTPPSTPATAPPTTPATAPPSTPATSAPVTTAGGGLGGPSHGGSPPPSHLCQVVGALEQMGGALPEPGAPNSQALAVAAAIAATAPGCTQSPPFFAGPSTTLCDLLAGVAEVATLGPTERVAADALFEGAGCGTTVPSTPASGQVVASVQAMACAVGVAAAQGSSAAFEQWGNWLSATAGCSPFQPQATLSGVLSRLLFTEVPQLAAALGDSTAEICGIEQGAGIPDPRCG